MRGFLAYLKETYAEWDDDDVSRHAAALAFYVTLSAAPLLFVVIAIAGSAFDRVAVRGRIIVELRMLLGAEGGDAVGAMLERLSTSEWNGPAAILAIVTLIVGASGVFLHLRTSLNTVWGVRPRPGGGLLAVVRQHMFSFATLVATGFLLLVTLVFGAALAAGAGRLAHYAPGSADALRLAYPVVSLVLTAALFALVFKFLPDVRVAWRDVIVGAIVTALLFAVGQALIGLYLGRGDFGSAYGAAGSFVIVLVWVYFASQILFVGAEFTQVWARRHGRPIVPSSNAVSLWMIDPKTGRPVRALPAKPPISPEVEREHEEMAARNR